MRDQIMDLARFEGGPCLSVFLPTRPRSPAAPPAAQLKRLLADGAQQLAVLGAAQETIDDLLAPARELTADPALWGQPHPGLALFAAPGMLRTCWLPYDVAALALSGARFHLKPLFPLLSEGAPFFVLALSKNHVRLLRATWDAVEPVALPGAPASLAETLRYDDFAPQRQVHPGTAGRGAAHGAVFYGHGATADTAKEELARYCRQVDRAVCAALGAGGHPLVLAGVSYVLAIYRAASSYPAILDRAVAGSPDHRSDEELRARAWPLVAPALRPRPEEAAGRCRALMATSPGRATGYLRTIVPAAARGQIETLIVAGDRQQWGAHDTATGELTLHATGRPGDEDLLDAAAVHTFRHGGEVLVMPADQVPGGELCAAILRQAPAA